MDRRQIKTRTAIFSAFEELLSEKSFEKISVQDIIDRANIGRSTFYAHFETKDELLKELCATLFAHVFSERPQREKTHDFSGEKGDAYRAAAHILYHLKDGRSDLLPILKGQSGELFLAYFKNNLGSLLTETILHNTEGESPAVPYDFLVSHISSSFVGTVQWWIKNGLKETPEEVAGYFCHLVMPIFK